jgi:hypothetical protein
VGPRIFTLDECNALIPEIVAAFEDLDAQRNRLVGIKKKMDVLEMIYGAGAAQLNAPDGREYRQYLEDIESIKKEYEAACGRIVETGAHLKSVDEGLVDFCGVIEGRLVEFCWKRGEPQVEYYHHIGEGFAGRRPIPAGV